MSSMQKLCLFHSDREKYEACVASGLASTHSIFARSAELTTASAYPLASCVCSEKDIGEGDELYDIVGHEEDDEDIYDDLMTVRSRCSVIAVRCILAVTVSRHFFRQKYENY